MKKPTEILRQSPTKVGSNELEYGPDRDIQMVYPVDNSLVCEAELMAAVIKCALAHVATAQHNMPADQASLQPLCTDLVVSTDQRACADQGVIVIMPGSQQATGDEGLIIGSPQTFRL